MKLNFKSIVILFLVGLLVIITVLPVFADTKEPYSNESYYNELCRGMGYNENRKVCEEYKSYLRDKIASDKTGLSSLQEEIKNIKSLTNKHQEELNRISAEIKNDENQIVTIESSIRATERHIVQLEDNIEKRIVEIEEKEAKVKEYISNSQIGTRVNGYIEFIMGAKDFTDIFMRMEGLKRIKEYNDDIINGLEIEREALETDKVSAEDSKLALVDDQNILEDRVALNITRKDTANQLLQQVVALEAEVQAKYESAQSKIQLSQDQMNSIKEIPVSSGWYHPLSGSNYYVSAYDFRYDSWGRLGSHNGTDYSTRGSRSNLYLPADSLVVAVNDIGCGDGSPSNTCGGGYGNNMVFISNVNGTVYGILFAHFTAGTIAVNKGQSYAAGTYLGKVGTSGSSTGMHLHVEITKLNASSIEEAYNNWSGNISFGSKGRYCAYGASIPCRVDAAVIWGDPKPW